MDKDDVKLHKGIINRRRDVSILNLEGLDCFLQTPDVRTINNQLMKTMPVVCIVNGISIVQGGGKKSKKRKAN